MGFVVANPGQNDVLLHNYKPCEDWEPIKNIDEPYVQEMGRFAVMEHVKNSQSSGILVRLTFDRVLSGETLKVAEGKKYCLTIEVKEDVVIPIMPPPPISIKLCVATVLECDKSWKLLSFEFLKA